MLHILLWILKLIGILLLIVLGLVLFLLAVILLVPIRYQGTVQKQTGLTSLSDLTEVFRAEGKVTWLLGLFALAGKFDRTLDTDIRIFGHSLLHKKPKKKKAKRKRELPQKEGVEEAVEEPLPQEDVSGDEAQSEEPVKKEEREDAISIGNSVIEDAKNEPEKNLPNTVSDVTYQTEDIHESGKGAAHEGKMGSVIRKISQIPSKLMKKIRDIANTIRRTLQNLNHGKETLQTYLDFWKKECTQTAKDHILREVKYLLHHILPRKAEGSVIFGFDDPATTGQVLGILCVLAVCTGNHLEIQGDFERKILEGDFSVKGHIRLCHIVKTAIVLFADKNIRATIRGFRRLTV